MRINQDKQVKEIDVTTEGARNIKKRVLIGPDEGSNNIVMRYFRILPEGTTPRHKHNYEHVIKILSGRGVAIDGSGKEHNVSAGLSVFVAPNEEHQFRNQFTEPFELLCIIPNVEQTEQKM